MQNDNYETYQTLLVNLNKNILEITLNRPHVKNAINTTLINELTYVLQQADADNEVRVIILTGGTQVFSVGADLKEMREYADVQFEYRQDFLAPWDIINTITKPIIGVVNGYALGGGCEIALMCDIIIAGTSAAFAQPEVKVGLMPGAGGTQRLVRSIGKAQAMDICLSGKLITAFEALNMGLISRVSEDNDALNEANTLAQILTSYSLGALIAIKHSIKHSFDTSLSQSLHQERQAFYQRLHSHDGKEGMSAFIEKRNTNFIHD